METAFSNSDIPAFSMEVNQALLKEDDDLLRQIFSQVFRHHHPEVANKVDVIFSLAQVCSNFMVYSTRVSMIEYPVSCRHGH